METSAPKNRFDEYTQKKIDQFRRIEKNLSTSNKEEKSDIEFLILRYQSLEDLLLPLLRSHVLYQLKLEKLQKKFDDQKNYINLTYLALTHDVELFDLLEKARNLRNEIVHEVCEDAELKYKEKAKSALALIAQIREEIVLRFEGKKPIPVLELYRQGWEDASKKISDRISALKEQLK